MLALRVDRGIQGGVVKGAGELLHLRVRRLLVDLRVHTLDELQRGATLRVADSFGVLPNDHAFFAGDVRVLTALREAELEQAA